MNWLSEDVLGKNDAQNQNNSQNAPSGDFGGTVRDILSRAAVQAAVSIGKAAANRGAEEIYNRIFKRFERPDYSIYPGLYNYELVKNELPRENISFYSDGVKLAGYYYKVPSPKGLVVMSHGIHAGHDDYLPIAKYFYTQGWNVFGYDYKGTYSSEGKGTVGMSESLVDLNHALDFVKSDSRFAGLKVCLVGHSWGGFATAAVLNLHKEVRAAFCIAGFNDAYTMILEKGFQYAGELASSGIQKTFLDTYQKKLFGDYIYCNAVGGINGVDIPVLLAHGISDSVISIDGQSIVSHAKEITNRKVEYYYGRGANSGHDSIWHSARAVAYQQDVKRDLERIKKQRGKDFTYDEQVEFYRFVNHEIYSEINQELFDRAQKIFEGV